MAHPVKIALVDDLLHDVIRGDSNDYGQVLPGAQDLGLDFVGEFLCIKQFDLHFVLWRKGLPADPSAWTLPSCPTI